MGVMTQEEVAERTGIDRSTLYRLESAPAAPAAVHADPAP